MGTGFVYWIMLLNMITSSGWWYLALRSWKLKRKAFAVGCFIIMIYFLVVSFIHFNAYVIIHEKYVFSKVLLRFISGGLAVIGTLIFVLYYNKYNKDAPLRD